MSKRGQLIGAIAIMAVLGLSFIALALQGSTSRRYRLDDGSLHSEGQVLNSHKEGRWSYYRRNGKLKQQGSYRRGYKSGIWFTYDARGRISKREYYQSGRLPSREDPVPVR